VLTPHLNVSDFPDSAYARELGEGVGKLRFGAALERLYLLAHLQRVRLRVRCWFTIAAAFGLFDLVARIGGLTRLLGPDRGRDIVWAYVVADICSVALAVLAWSPLYRSVYMPASRIAMPIYGLALTAFVAQSMANGHAEQIATLTMFIVVVFFFAGLLFRTAVLTTLVIISTFSLSAWAFGLPMQVLVPSWIMLMITASIGVIGYRDIELSYRRNFLENALLHELVARDELSGLMNRRAFDEHLQRLWQHAQRDRRSIAVLMVDIDHFKSYNDSRGHQAGDAALRSVGQLLTRFARRPLDLAARYGGDEFVAVLYDLASEHVHDVAESIRRDIQQTELRSESFRAASGPGEHAAGSTNPKNAAAVAPSGAVTVSIGVGLVMPVPGRTLEGAIQLADEALYEAKQAGRNRVVVKGPEGHHRLQTGSFRALSVE
jgi:diguanylate cyclase (GGDEF)-like protein